MLNLTVLVFLPLIGALLVAAMPKNAHALQRMITLIAMTATAIVGIALCLDFDGASAAAQHVVQRPWFTLPGGIQVSFNLGLDGLSVLMVGLTALLGPIVVLSTWGHIQTRVKEFMVWLLIMQTGMLGVFGPPGVQEAARQGVLAQCRSVGIYPASIHALYLARGRGEVPPRSRCRPSTSAG